MYRWKIYIPIWLDLLYISVKNPYYRETNLHSNMVRFIIELIKTKLSKNFEFTFQYGQIYYSIHIAYPLSILIIYIPIWLDLLCYNFTENIINIDDLHSNMVRFIMTFILSKYFSLYLFTFQYGQIYYKYNFIIVKRKSIIYIPIWLDLLSTPSQLKIAHKSIFTFQYGQIYYAESRNSTGDTDIIYIPIWLDLL